jgi:hypothetical protein
MLFPLPRRLEGPASGASEDGSDEESKKSAREPRSDLLQFMHATRVGPESHANYEADEHPQERTHEDGDPDDHPPRRHPKDAQEDDNEQRDDD